MRQLRRRSAAVEDDPPHTAARVGARAVQPDIALERARSIRCERHARFAQAPSPRLTQLPRAWDAEHADVGCVGGSRADPSGGKHGRSVQQSGRPGRPRPTGWRRRRRETHAERATGSANSAKCPGRVKRGPTPRFLVLAFSYSSRGPQCNAFPLLCSVSLAATPVPAAAVRRAGLCLPSLLRVCRLVRPPLGVTAHHLGTLGVVPLQLAPRVLRLRLPRCAPS